jgi:tripeptide aminopeptidase
VAIDRDVRTFLREDALRRFLAYVAIDTTSSETGEACPSTPGQFDLARRIEHELRELGLSAVELDEHCYLYATLPASGGSSGHAIGLLAHLDTSPSVTGAGVKPILHADYRGHPIAFPDDPSLLLTPADSPELGRFVGDDIVTASGRTLLGADDKAGCAELVAAAAAFRRYPSLPHPEIRLCFTPDEEIGRGTAKIRVERLGEVAYTLDGGMVGELETECFDARAATIRFKGMNVHPGYAKNRMVNAAGAAARFYASLPEAQTPEHTDGRDGFYHLTSIKGDESEAILDLIVRGFAASENDDRIRLLEATRMWMQARSPGLVIEIAVREQYRNMREVLDRHPAVADVARRAMEAAGIEVIRRPIRGGTDGARLCFAGVPTPNLFAGGMLPHSRKEWIAVSALERATELVIGLAGIWHEGRAAS